MINPSVIATFTFYPFKLYSTDYQNLINGKQIDDSTVDISAQLILRERNECAYIDAVSITIFMSEDKKIKEDTMVQFSKNIKLNGKKYLFLPYMLSNHWILIVVNLQSNFFNIFTSLGKPTDWVKKGSISAMLKLLFEIYNKTNKTTLKLNYKYKEPDNYPKQTNLIDCGVYILKYMHYISNENTMEIVSADEFRNYLSEKIMNNNKNS